MTERCMCLDALLRIAVYGKDAHLLAAPNMG